MRINMRVIRAPKKLILSNQVTLRVDTRLKLLAKWDPKRYGDATTVKHADADGEKLPIDDVTKFTRLAAMAAQASAATTALRLLPTVPMLSP